MITKLPRLHDEPPNKPNLAGADHPMRKVTQQIAFEPASWTPERAKKVGELFDKLAPDWESRLGEDGHVPLEDALARGKTESGKLHSGVCVELGSGTGRSTEVLAQHFDTVISIDLSFEMLVLAPAEFSSRIRGDSSALPIQNKSIDTLVIENMFLFPNEIERVLKNDGCVVWLSSLGDRTPIYLPAEKVDEALPGEWEGIASDAGWGSWCVLGRVDNIHT